MTLKEYTEQRGISIRQLSNITKVSFQQLYRISNNRNYNATVKTMIRIAGGTQEEFGDALLPNEYLNVSAILGERWQ